MRIFFNMDKNVNTSMVMTENNIPFLLHNVELLRDPFQTNTIVKLTKIFNDGNERNDYAIIQEMMKVERNEKSKILKLKEQVNKK